MFEVLLVYSDSFVTLVIASSKYPVSISNPIKDIPSLLQAMAVEGRRESR